MQAAMRNAIFDNRPLANMDDVQNAIKALEFEKDKTKRNIGYYN